MIQKTERVQISHAEMQQHVTRELGRIWTPQNVLDVNDDLGQIDFPRTLSGKVKKHVLKEIVEQYLTSKDQSNNSHAVATSLLQLLMNLFARATGIEPGEISDTTSVYDVADSISLMRYASFVEKELNKTFRL